MKAGVDLAYILISQLEPLLDFEIWGIILFISMLSF